MANKYTSKYTGAEIDSLLENGTAYDLVITQAQMQTFMQKSVVNLPYISIPKNARAVNVKMEDGSLLSSVTLTLHMAQPQLEIRIFGASVIDETAGASTLTNMNLYVEDVGKTIKLNTSQEPVIMGVAKADSLGGVKAKPATEEDAQEVHITSKGELVTKGLPVPPKDGKYTLVSNSGVLSWEKVVA